MHQFGEDGWASSSVPQAHPALLVTRSSLSACRISSGGDDRLIGMAVRGTPRHDMLDTCLHSPLAEISGVMRLRTVSPSCRTAQPLLKRFAASAGVFIVCLCAACALDAA